MLALIAAALTILGCSDNNAPPDEATEVDESNSKPARMPMEMEPKIVVIMAGDEFPRYLAWPAGAGATSSRLAD